MGKVIQFPTKERQQQITLEKRLENIKESCARINTMMNELRRFNENEETTEDSD